MIITRPKGCRGISDDLKGFQRDIRISHGHFKGSQGNFRGVPGCHWNASRGLRELHGSSQPHFQGVAEDLKGVSMETKRVSEGTGRFQKRLRGSQGRLRSPGGFKGFQRV